MSPGLDPHVRAAATTGPRTRAARSVAVADEPPTSISAAGDPDPMTSSTQSADSHDRIRVHGARVNNLKDVDVEIPKRRLTAFTGVSGSGKSSLVFGTIAAESRRLINETYSAFVQGFMPTLGRPDVDVLDGLTTAILVDQERLGADPRSTVGTATDTYAMLRILYSRLGDPYVGPPTAFSFNVPTRTASGSMNIDKGRGERVVVRKQVYLGGMCPRCEGRGSVNDLDLTEVYDESKSLSEGALKVPGYSMDGWYGRIFGGSGFFDMDKPIAKFSKRELDDLLYKEPIKIKVDGINLTYEGVVTKMRRSMLAKDVDSLQPHVRAFVERAATFRTCPDCEGTRLTPEARSSRIGGRASPSSVRWRSATSPPGCASSTSPRWRRWSARCGTPSTPSWRSAWAISPSTRPSGTLSGGEAQRVKLVRQLGSSLTDVTYVFDEPTIGLHPHDIARMNDLLIQLRDKGNTVLVVEHKPEAIAIADHVIDLGPGAGSGGGQVVFEGTVEALKRSDTVTGRHLEDRAVLKQVVRQPTGVLEVRGADTHNLRDVDVDIPTGVLVVITGVAGSGKSSLVHGSVSPREGVITVDQGAIRGSRRSNPATYTGLLDPIRKAFAKANGVKPALFSANSEGACPACNGAGVIYTDLGDHGRHRHPLRDVRGQAVRRLGPGLHLRWPGHHRGAGDVGGAGPGVLRRRRGADAGCPHDPVPPRRRGAGLPDPRPAADHAVRRRAATPQAGHPPRREGRRLRPRRAHVGAPPRRRRAAARPARPDRRLRAVGDRDRAPPGRDGPCRLDHRPRPGRRPRRWHARLRGHAGRPGHGRVDSDRAAPRGVRRLRTRPAGLRPGCGAGRSADRTAPAGAGGPGASGAGWASSGR